MAKKMRLGEKLMALQSSGGKGKGREHARRRAGDALSRLEAHATDEDGAALVAVILETAAELLERQEIPGPLPEHERRVWESTGAAFEDAGAVTESRVRAFAAFGDLVSRCFRGDAGVAEALGVDRSRISQRVNERSLYAFRGPDGERYFPRWQIHEGSALPGLKTVLCALDAGAHPLTVDRWLQTPNVDLESDGEPVTPLEWLATGGDPGAAAELAADV